MQLSIISPVYNAEKIIDELVDRIIREISIITVDFEVILVDDGSKDNSWNAISSNCKKDNRIKGIKLSRNFGQHYAITAGIEASSGEVNVLMDCDLQDDPSSIHLLYEKYKEGYEVVFTKRQNRKHSYFKKFTASIFNNIFKLVSHKDFDVNAGTLILFGKKARMGFLKINDYDRLYLQLFKWVGFKRTYVEVKHNRRFEGETTYNFSKLLNIALQGFTSFSNKLLYFSIIIGIAFSVLSFLSITIIVLLYFLHGFQSGWASLISSIFLCTGILLLNMGILGLYVGKVFNQAKNRPLYLIEQTINK